MKNLFVCFFVLFVVACTPDTIDNKKVVVVVDDDTEVEATEDTDTGIDSSEDPVNFQHATLDYCSVEITIFFEDGEAVGVDLINDNDTAVFVKILNQTTGGVALKNCLWPMGEWVGEDQEEVGFSIVDKLTLSIYIGEGLTSYLCLDTSGELLDTFFLCDEHEISFVFK